MKKYNTSTFVRCFCAILIAIFSSTIVFAAQSDSNDDSVAYSFVGAETNYYNSLDALFSKITNDTTIIILKDCYLPSSKITITNKIELYSTNLVPLSPSSTSAFEITNDAALNISNITISSASLDQTLDQTLFNVRGGNLTFNSGTTISNLCINNGNVVKIISGGSFNMLDGSTIKECEMDGSNSGGAVYLVGSDSTFNFFGGTISECSSPNYGGAIYVGKNAKVVLGGSATAIDNTASESEKSDIYFVSNSNNDPLLLIENNFTGKVNLYYTGRTDISNSFAVVSTSNNTADFKEKIINSADKSLYATLSADGETLIWDQETIDDSIKPLPDENIDNAEARVTNGSTTNYYAKISDALTIAGEGEQIELLKDASLSINVTLGAEKVIFDGCGHTLSRDGNFVIDIGEKKSLLVTNIVLDGSNKSGRFFNVKGGSLIFEDGAILKNVIGDTLDFVAPIVVWGGSFTMNGGEIRNCKNSCIPEPGGPLTAGALVMSGGVAFLNDGLITECVGARAGGAGFYNRSTAYVNGNFTILTNANPFGAVCNLVIQDLSKMIVTSNIIGKIGCYDGFLADTNIAAYVDESFASSTTPSNLVASALRFRHDILDVKAVPVTNGTDTLFVWRTALGENANFKTKIDGVEKIYEQVLFPIEDPDFVECPPFAFTSITESENKTEWLMTIKPVKEYCKYTFYASSDLKNWEVVYNTEALSKDSISPNEEYIFKNEMDGDKRFWRAEGKNGLK